MASIEVTGKTTCSWLALSLQFARHFCSPDCRSPVTFVLASMGMGCLSPLTRWRPLLLSIWPFTECLLLTVRASADRPGTLNAMMSHWRGSTSSSRSARRRNVNMLKRWWSIRIAVVVAWFFNPSMYVKHWFSYTTLVIIKNFVRCKMSAESC